jgi:hypothetical protein
VIFEKKRKRERRRRRKKGRGRGKGKGPPDLFSHETTQTTAAWSTYADI